MDFNLAYNVNPESVVELFTEDQFSGYQTLGFAQSNNCTYFVPSSVNDLYPLSMDFAKSGFIALNQLRLYVKAPLVASRSDVNFTIGTCSAFTTNKTEISCVTAYDLVFDWEQLMTSDCASMSTSRISGLHREYTIYLDSVYEEYFSDLKRRSVFTEGVDQDKASKQEIRQERRLYKRTEERATREELGFKVLVPLYVEVSSVNHTLLAPPTLHVKAMITSRSFNPVTFIANITIKSKVSNPGLLILPRIQASPSVGLTASIQLLPGSNETCPNASVSCEQSWLVVLAVNKTLGSCNINSMLSVTWNTSCHYSCWDSGKRLTSLIP